MSSQSKVLLVSFTDQVLTEMTIEEQQLIINSKNYMDIITENFRNGLEVEETCIKIWDTIAEKNKELVLELKSNY